jgi:hypothetical protein
MPMEAHGQKKVSKYQQGSPKVIKTENEAANMYMGKLALKR